MERQIVITYNGKKFTINFPNVGQLIDIESLKSALTNGKYGAFAASGIKSMYFVLDMVDTIAFVSVMCPRLKNFITEEEVSDLTQLSPDVMKPIVDIYKKDIAPWFNKNMQELQAVAHESIEQTKNRDDE